MFRGGELIVDPAAYNYYSYLVLGLRCRFCGENVHLRKGKSRRAHFAHFPLAPSFVENCKLRASVHSTKTSWSDLTSEGKGQRLKIFQEYFLTIITSNNQDFFEKIQFIHSKIDAEILEIITRECCQYFVTKSDAFINQCCTSYKNKLNKESLLQIHVICEVIDYLSVKSSAYLLEKLIQYSIYAFYKKQFFKLEFHEDIIETHNICNNVVEILENINWLEVFSQSNIPDKERQLNNYKSITTKKNQETNNQIYHPVPRWANVYGLYLCEIPSENQIWMVRGEIRSGLVIVHSLQQKGGNGNGLNEIYFEELRLGKLHIIMSKTRDNKAFPLKEGFITQVFPIPRINICNEHYWKNGMMMKDAEWLIPLKREVEKFILEKLLDKEVNVIDMIKTFIKRNFVAVENAQLESIAITLVRLPSNYWQKLKRHHPKCQISEALDIVVSNVYILKYPRLRYPRKVDRINLLQEVIREVTGVSLTKKVYP
jgi:hypothetical protein